MTDAASAGVSCTGATVGTSSTDCSGTMDYTLTPWYLPIRSSSATNSAGVWKRSEGCLASIFITNPSNKSGIESWNFFGFTGSS